MSIASDVRGLPEEGVDYSRQEAMDEELRHLGTGSYTSHMVIGCGGIGAWLALMLAMRGHRSLILMDGQTLEASNLNRLPFPPHWAGLNKAKATARLVRTLRPDCVTRLYPSHLTENTLELVKLTLERESTVVWDCTDDARIQTKLYQHIQTLRQTARHPIDYRKVGYEGFKVGTYSDLSIWFTNRAGYQPGYRSSSANVMSSTTAAALAIIAQGLGAQHDVKVDLRDVVNRGDAEIVPSTVDQIVALHSRVRLLEQSMFNGEPLPNGYRYMHSEEELRREEIDL